jgi:hypothetical protein
MSLRFVPVLLISLVLPSPGRAQQPDDAAASQNGEPDLAAEVHQLKSEIDRLSRELERVSAELERLQNEHAAEQVVAATPSQEPALPPAPPAPVASKPAPSAMPAKSARGKSAARTEKASSPPATDDDRTPTTMLVFQDGKHIEARNYAIVGQTLWVYTEQDSKRFPLTDLNLEATRRANAERGVAFQVPASR